jgi:hypothetical protein
MAKVVLPRLHVIILCDEIEPSPSGDEVFDLRGVRTSLSAPAFPYIHPQLCVYLQATGHEGTARCSLAVVDSGTDLPVLTTPEQTAHFRGPLSFLPVCWWLRDCWFPEPGVYYIQVSFDGKLLGERALSLSQNEAVTGNGHPLV